MLTVFSRDADKAGFLLKLEGFERTGPLAPHHDLPDLALAILATNKIHPAGTLNRERKHGEQGELQ